MEWNRSAPRGNSNVCLRNGTKPLVPQKGIYPSDVEPTGSTESVESGGTTR
jgi:hypothetical protein